MLYEKLHIYLKLKGMKKVVEKAPKTEADLNLTLKKKPAWISLTDQQIGEDGDQR